MPTYENGMPSPSIPSRSVAWDPRDKDLTPFTIGEFTIHRQNLVATLYTRYVITLNGTMMDTQISMPDAGDCQSAQRRHQHGIRSAKQSLTLSVKKDEGTLTSRILKVCTTDWMTLSDIYKRVKHPPQTVSPIITRLYESGQLERKGRGQSAYEYRATGASAPR
jgi:hypothetical protein